MVLHSFNPSIPEAKAAGSLILKPVWSSSRSIRTTQRNSQKTNKRKKTFHCSKRYTNFLTYNTNSQLLFYMLRKIQIRKSYCNIQSYGVSYTVTLAGLNISQCHPDCLSSQMLGLQDTLMSGPLHSQLHLDFVLSFFFLSFPVDAIILNILHTCSGWICMNVYLHMQKLADSLRESVLSFHCVDSECIKHRLASSASTH